MNSWRDCISREIYVSKEVDASFNFLKINLMAHWVELIRRYEPFQQNSAERYKQAHRTNPKNCWNASNHNLSYLPQVITFQHCILC